MGFKKVYLLGCDMGYAPNKENHFYEDKGVDWTKEYCAHENSWQLQAHKRIKLVCDDRGIEVYNATIGGELEIYPRVDIYDILR